MEPKEIKFEELKELNYGDQIIMKDPLFQELTPYVLMSNVEDKSFYFLNGGGASLLVTSQETIDGFNVKLIDDTHPNWDSDLCKHGKQLGEMLDVFVEDDNIGIDQMADKLLKIK